LEKECSIKAGRPIVAKSLTSGLTATNRSLMTTSVNLKQLDPNYPWFLQEKIESNLDVTVFCCNNEFFAFSRDRTNLKGLDWRSEQNLNANIQEWLPYELSAKQKISIKDFCEDINVSWGRIDFLENEDHLIFLEFNANGQWVFLDYTGHANLVKKVANYLIS
jgi:glutathione synthase/RimK-type ligase-like ATP-grasp enzyme